MYLQRPVIDAAAAVCEEAGREVAALLASEDVADEDDFTSALTQAIRTNLGGVRMAGVAWRGRKATSRYAGSEENRSGADLLGVLDVDLPEIAFRKGFLVQAKRDRPGRGMAELRRQCQQMLAISPDSFVFLYDRKGVHVVPALLYADGRLALHHVEPWTLGDFFKAHFSSFIGDRKLGVRSRAEFATVLDIAPPPEILEIKVSVADAAGDDRKRSN